MSPRPRRVASGRESLEHYRTLAELRYRIRRFIRLREIAARRVGLEPQQYLLLLHVKALEGIAPGTVGTLAERLQLNHNSTVGLIDRLARRGLVRRDRDPADRRRVRLVLTPSGGSVLRRLAAYSIEELQSAGPELVKVLRRLLRAARRPRARARQGGQR